MNRAKRSLMLMHMFSVAGQYPEPRRKPNLRDKELTDADIERIQRAEQKRERRRIARAADEVSVQ